MSGLTYGSVASGIEAASCAWHPLGWRPAFLSEIDPFARAVLAHHYPSVPLHGDFTTIEAGQYEPIDVLVGGTPCQSFSVAGLRGGLGDPRGNLALEFLRLADRLRPSWVVWENVPGVLSSWSDDPDRAPADCGDGYELVHQRNDFDCFIAGMVELGYGVAYRILDAQFFGVAQRRRRVFVVGYLGDWRRAAAVLFERAILCGNPPPRRGAGKDATAGTLRGTDGGIDVDHATVGHVVSDTLRQHTRPGSNSVGTIVGALTARMARNGAGANDEVKQGRLIAFGGNNQSGQIDVATALNAHGGAGRMDFESETFVLPFDTTQVTSATNRSAPAAGDPCHPLAAGAHAPTIAFNARQDPEVTGERTGPLDTDGSTQAVLLNGETDASTSQADAASPLRALRNAVGAQAFAEWGSRILDSLQSPEVLRRALHGEGIRRAASQAGLWLDDGALPRPESLPSEGLRKLWEEGPDGCSSSGRGLAQQLAAELAAPVPKLPPEIASRCLVRRLTPRECERLMGFPDDYTAIMYRGKPAADGPRYKALGNSMAVPCMRWLGERIARVDALP